MTGAPCAGPAVLNIMRPYVETLQLSAGSPWSLGPGSQAVRRDVAQVKLICMYACVYTYIYIYIYVHTHRVAYMWITKREPLVGHLNLIPCMAMRSMLSLRRWRGCEPPVVQRRDCTARFPERLPRTHRRGLTNEVRS